MARKKQTREDELFAELIKLHGGSEEALLGPEGLLKQLTKRLVEQAQSGCIYRQPGYGEDLATGFSRV